MKIGLIGAAGFVGSGISHALNDEYDVVNVDSLKFGFRENLPPDCNFIHFDFQKLPQPIIDSFDVIVFCATSNIIYAMDKPLDTILNNAVGGIEFLNRYDGKIIYTSTTSVYGNADEFPTKEDAEIKLTNAYDMSKMVVEYYLEYRGNYTTLRLSNVMGERQRSESNFCGVVGRFLNAAIENKPMEIYGDGNATRDYTHISDVVAAVKRAMELPALEETLNIATSIETSINDLGKMVWKAANKPQQYIRREPRKIDIISRRCLDISKAKELLGWEPKVSLDEGIKLTMDWMKAEKEKLVLRRVT